MSPTEASPARAVQLKDLTTLRVGGPAELWEVTSDAAIAEAQQEPFLVLGAGSNLLVHDRGVDRRVIKLGRPYNTLQTFEGSADFWVGAATPVPGLVRRAQRAGLSGLEGLLGVPAVIGGAIAMNAGTRFGEIGDVLVEVDAVIDGSVERLPAEAIGLSYRHAALPEGAVLTRARLRLTPSTPEAVQRRLDRVDDARKGQPKVKSAGCAFKNPPDDSAGRLIDAAELKGLRVGDAMVSHEHGNFIVNLGAATSADVVELLERVRAAVAVPLEVEWIRWGF